MECDRHSRDIDPTTSRLGPLEISNLSCRLETADAKTCVAPGPSSGSDEPVTELVPNSHKISPGVFNGLPRGVIPLSNFSVDHPAIDPG